jgi:DNA-binding MarR family transcriptional regulator
MNHISESCHAGSSRGFTDKQGQYLAFIHAYTLVMDRPPAEADLQRHFGVTPPSVHGMVLSLERAGLIRREPRRARSITILVEINDLPALRPRQTNQSKSL